MSIDFHSCPIFGGFATAPALRSFLEDWRRILRQARSSGAHDYCRKWREDYSARANSSDLLLRSVEKVLYCPRSSHRGIRSSLDFNSLRGNTQTVASTRCRMAFVFIFRPDSHRHSRGTHNQTIKQETIIMRRNVL